MNQYGPQPRPVLLVGRDNPYHADPYFALWHEPANAAGDLLRRVILGLSVTTYLSEALVRRVNLIPSGGWDPREGRRRGPLLLREWAGRGPLVALGRDVGRALKLRADFFQVQRRAGAPPVVYLPHPSGQNCAVWRKPENVAKARELLRRVAPHVPWGEAAG